MKDFVRIDIISTLENAKVFDALSLEFSKFSWRRGDSDAQGEYVSGRNQNKVHIQCWSSENPMILSISFRGSEMDMQEREEILKKIIDNVVPRIGEIARLDA